MPSTGDRFKSFKTSLALLLLGLFLGLAVAGCGGGGGGGGSSASTGAAPPAETTARIQLDFQLQARTVPAEVVQLRITGYSAAGQLIYGPVVRGKASQIVLTDVPVLVTSIRVEYLRNDATPVGLYVEATQLAPGQTKVIVDPPYQDFSNTTFLSRVEVSPASASVAAGIEQRFAAVAVFSDGFVQTLTEDAQWSVGDGTVASVSNSAGTRGRTRGLKAGTTTVSAAYAGKTGQANLAVTPAELVSLAVTPATASLPAGRTQQFTATGTFTDSTTADLTSQVTWSSSNQGIATIETAPARAEVPGRTAQPGLATGVSAGQATITARHVASNRSATATLTVTAAVLESLQVTPASPSVAKGRTWQFTATGTFSDRTTRDLTSQVNWTSSASSTASVSNLAGSKGLASTHAVGQATIAATDPGTAVQGSTTLSVTAAELVSVAVTPTNPSIPLGRTQQFQATGTYTDSTTQDLTTTVTWSSSSDATATLSNAVGSKGLAASAAVGQTTITATDSASGKSGSTTLTVSAAALVSIAVTPTNPSVAKGRTQQFTATGTFTNNTTRDLTADVTWASSNTSVATLSNAAGSKGLASAAGLGQSTIRATDPASQVNGSTTLTVTAAVLVSLSVTPTNPRIPLGQAQQLAATGTYSDNTTQDLTAQVTWSSLGATVADVSNAAGTKGLVSTVAIGGPITVRATDPGTLVQGDVSVEVVAAVLSSIAVTPANPSVAKGRTQRFVATGTFSDQTTRDLTDQVAWASSNQGVATITSAVLGRQAVADGGGATGGLATALGVGQANITATYPGSQVSGSTRLTVTAAELVSLAVTPATASVAKGRTQQFTATGTYSDATTQDLTTTVTWSSSADATAPISNAAGSKGLATGLAEGEVAITATDSSTGLQDTVTLTVTRAVLASIAVTPAGSSVAQGKTLQFTATGTYSDATTQDLTTTVTWSSSSDATATLSNAAGSKGLATGVAPGGVTITATDSATQVAGQTGLTVTPPQITVVYKNRCTEVVSPQGLTVQWVNQVTFAVVTGTLDADGRAVFTRDQITPGVTWQARILSGNGFTGGSARLGCWDGTHANWGCAAAPPTGEPAGEVWLYIVAPGCALPPPLPPAGSASWGNAQGS